MTRPPPTVPGAPAPPDSWLDQVSAQGLPVLPESLAAVRDLRGRRTLSAKRLAALALADPALALNLLRGAGQAGAQSNPGRPPRIPENLAHALLLLGVEPACRLIEELASLEATTAPANRCGLVRALARASHAGSLAQAWAQRCRIHDGEGMRIAAHAYHLGELALWAYHAEAKTLFERLDGTGESESGEAQARILGVDTVAVARQLADRWRLPDLARTCLQANPTQRPPSTPASPATLVILAQRVAAAASVDWYGDEMARCQSRLADVFRIEPAGAIAMTHADTARAARDFSRPHELIAARSLMLGPGGETTTPSSEPEVAAGSRAPDRTQGQRDCVRLLEACHTGRMPALKALEGLVHAMRAALGVDRVMLALVTKDRRVLAARFFSFSRAEAGKALVGLRVPLDQSNLFSRLMRSPQGLWLNTSNRAKVWPLVPSSLQAVLSEHTFLVMSLFVNAKPIGLFYADCLSPTERIDERKYRQFKRLCQATSRALASRGG